MRERAAAGGGPYEADTADVGVPLRGRRTMRSLLAEPVGAPGPVPGIVLIHDLLGWSEDIRRVAVRLASHGYAVLAPDIYDFGRVRPLCVIRTLRDHQARRGPTLARIDAAREHLSAHPGVVSDAVGIMGFCMGGGFAITYGATGKATVAAPFYGQATTSLETTRAICPVVGGWGERDEVFTKEGRRLEGYLEELGVAHDLAFYPGVGHAYMQNPDGGTSRLVAVLGRRLHAAYDHDAAEDSWRRLLAFFAEHLVSGQPGAR